MYLNLKNNLGIAFNRFKANSGKTLKEMNDVIRVLLSRTVLY